jgi:hypothetical protein
MELAVYLPPVLIECAGGGVVPGPFLLNDPKVGLIFPADAIAQAKHDLAMAPGGLGNIYHIVV